MTLLIIYFLLAVCVSFLCSILEAVLLSTPLSYLEIVKSRIREEAGKNGYDRTQKRHMHSVLIFGKLKEQAEKSLSAILSLNTIANTVGAAGVGAQSAIVFDNAYVGLCSGVLTLTILIFSEILPKSIGARYWRQLCLGAGRAIRILRYVCSPFVLLSEGVTWLVTRGKKDPGVSREEVNAIVTMGSKEGIFEGQELQGLKSMLQLQDLRVRDIMTPRMVSVTASEEMTVNQFYKERNYLKYSRIPVYEGDNPENITGFVLLKNVFELVAADKHNVKLKDIKRPIFIATESQKLLSLWNRMQQAPGSGEKETGADITGLVAGSTEEGPNGEASTENAGNAAENKATGRNTEEQAPVQTSASSVAAARRKRGQIAMVVDEYGTFVGLVTVEDMVETMLGMEIIDEKDTITDMQAYARKKWTSSKTYRKIEE